uniref:flagellar biosynthetic protein FliR n=1 Tax=Klebsiella aerogenes TaxID=548 RepID=UPI001D0D2CAE|nr:flagellar biosynthetic protein FliR [Klebsiella aerogenes]
MGIVLAGSVGAISIAIRPPRPIFTFLLICFSLNTGAALGLTMQLAFAAVRLAGEVIGMQMGLSFATFFDPSAAPIRIC